MEITRAHPTKYAICDFCNEEKEVYTGPTFYNCKDCNIKFEKMDKAERDKITSNEFSGKY